LYIQDFALFTLDIGSFMAVCTVRLNAAFLYV